MSWYLETLKLAQSYSAVEIQLVNYSCKKYIDEVNTIQVHTVCVNITA